MTSTSPRRLVLLRHAKAEVAGSLDDHLRPLALLGRRQAAIVGESLAASALLPDHVLCSSAVRTRQTWDLVRANVGHEPTSVVVTDGLYTAGVRALLDLLRECDPDARTVLVVGHEPTVSQLAAALASPASDPAAVARVRVGVPTASYTVLDVPGDWAGLAPDGAVLRELVTQPH
ncbi:SixA phosphatase family protein [Cellulomonas hominis]